MYESHFGLSRAPFSLTPDTALFYGVPSHVEAIHLCLSALKMGEGIIKITGEVGTGKTLVCRMLLKELTHRYELAYLPNPMSDASVFYRALARELGIAHSGSDHTQLLIDIQHHLLELAAVGEPVVLLCDEAQALSDEVLEAIRLLGNLETEQQKLLHIILLGQPELDERLHTHHLRQLLQRITFSAWIKPLSFAETAAYIDHRLENCGVTGRVFSIWAKQLIWRASGGIPRLVHQICHKAMLVSMTKDHTRVTLRTVYTAISDTPCAHRRSITALLWG